MRDARGSTMPLGNQVIFALSSDDLGLTAFASEKEAVAYCEGIDVEQGGWQFFASDGRRLTAKFTNPNVRGRFSVVSGSYVLEPGSDDTGLEAVLDSVTYVEGCGLRSVADVRHLIG